MLKHLQAFFIAIALLLPTAAIAAQHELSQKVSAGGVSADVSVFPVRPADYEIIVTFTSADQLAHPAGCMSLYRELRYALYDANGSMIPINREALSHPPVEKTGISLSKSDMGHPWNCARYGTKTSGSRTFLSTLYPGLRRGTYTLQVTFAPTSGGGPVPLLPIKISIPTGITQ